MIDSPTEEILPNRSLAMSLIIAVVCGVAVLIFGMTHHRPFAEAARGCTFMALVVLAILAPYFLPLSRMLYVLRVNEEGSTLSVHDRNGERISVTTPGSSDATRIRHMGPGVLLVRGTDGDINIYTSLSAAARMAKIFSKQRIR